MAKLTWTIDEINTFDRDDFVTRLDGLFEGSPWVAAETWPARPFADRVALHRALCRTMLTAARDRQLTLIRAHPDLAGRAALAGTLTRESTGEQEAAGLDLERLTGVEVAKFTTNNAAYKERFGFPFVICAREHQKKSILDGFSARLGNSHETEMATALGEVKKIAWYRLADLVHDEREGVR